MQINWLFFTVSLFLLLMPAPVLYSAVAKERLATLQSHAFSLEQMLISWQHWLDLARAAGGAFLLVSSFTPNSEVKSTEIIVLAANGLVLAVAVCAQTVHYRKGLFFAAPVFFLWGLLVVLAPLPAAFAIVFSAAFARLLDHVDLHFLVLAGLVAVVGFLLEGFTPSLALAGGLAILPLLVSYAAAGSLTCYSIKIAA